MKFETIVRHEAEIDIYEAAKWYESNLKGLGDSFLISIDEAIKSILRNPEHIL